MWLAVALALIQFTVVILRYVFSIGFIPMQELIWYLSGTMFMLGSGYTLLMDGHVRVDVLYREADPRKKAMVDLIGCLVFLLPLCIMTLILTTPFVINSWKIFEGSKEASGIRGIFLLKSVILGWALLLGLQGVALALRALSYLRGETGAYAAGGRAGLAGD
jgi:TRAP-type mannitol/chloroaromatic compound transport system permease small subunit